MATVLWQLNSQRRKFFCGKGKVEGEQEQSLEQDGGQGDEDAGGAAVCSVSVARQRRRVMGITMKRTNIKSCIPYVTQNSMTFSFAGDDWGTVFLRASTGS